MARLSLLANDADAPASVLVTHHVEEIPPGYSHGLLLRDGAGRRGGAAGRRADRREPVGDVRPAAGGAAAARPLHGLVALTDAAAGPCDRGAGPSASKVACCQHTGQGGSRTRRAGHEVADGDGGGGRVTEFVRLEVDGGVGTIRLDRPPMNAIRRAVQDELRSAADEADRARRRARGDRLRRREGVRRRRRHQGDGVADLRRDGAVAGPCRQGWLRVAAIPKPAVAAITGYALGGGWRSRWRATRRIAADNATLAVPRSCSASSPAAGGRSGWPGSSGRPGRRTWSSPGRFVRPTRRSRSAWSTSWSLRPTSTPGARAYVEPFAHGPALALRGGEEGDRRRAGRRPAARGWTSSRTCSRGCSRPTTSAIGMASFVEHGPGKAKFTGR